MAPPQSLWHNVRNTSLHFVHVRIADYQHPSPSTTPRQRRFPRHVSTASVWRNLLTPCAHSSSQFMSDRFCFPSAHVIPSGFKNVLAFFFRNHFFSVRFSFSSAFYFVCFSFPSASLQRRPLCRGPHATRLYTCKLPVRILLHARPFGPRVRALMADVR